MIVVCIADTTRARFYAQDVRGASLRLVDEIAHPEGGLKNIDLVTDRPGSTRSGVNRAIAAKNEPREVEHGKLARAIAGHLEKARAKGELQEVVLVMGPRLLGAVKGEMGAPLRRCVAATIESVIAHLDENALARHLKGRWPVANPVFADQAIPLRM